MCKGDIFFTQSSHQDLHSTTSKSIQSPQRHLQVQHLYKFISRRRKRKKISRTHYGNNKVSQTKVLNVILKLKQRKRSRNIYVVSSYNRKSIKIDYLCILFLFHDNFNNQFTVASSFNQTCVFFPNKQDYNVINCLNI